MLVVAFEVINLWSAFLQGVAKRGLSVMLTACYDDASAPILACARGREQRYRQDVFRLFGWPLACVHGVSKAFTCSEIELS